MQLSEVIIHTRKLFREVTGKAKTMALEHVPPQVIEERLRIDKDQEEYRKWLERMDYDKKGCVQCQHLTYLIQKCLGSTECALTQLTHVPFATKFQSDESVLVEWPRGHELHDLGSVQSSQSSNWQNGAHRVCTHH